MGGITAELRKQTKESSEEWLYAVSVCIFLFYYLVFQP